MYLNNIQSEIRYVAPQASTATTATATTSTNTVSIRSRIRAATIHHSTKMDNVLESWKQIHTPRMDRFVERIRENAPQIVETLRSSSSRRGPPSEGDLEREIQNELEAGVDLHDDEFAAAVAAAAAAKARMEHENRSSQPLRRMVRNLRQQCPEDWRGTVQKLWNGEHELDYEDCDANGRPVASGQYNASLNEPDEAREQPPRSPSVGIALSNHRERARQVMYALRNSQTPQEAFQKARSAATSKKSVDAPPEYYTNFNDERMSHRDAVGSYSAPQQTPTKSTLMDQEYAEMDDGTGRCSTSSAISINSNIGNHLEPQHKQVDVAPTRKQQMQIPPKSPLHSTAHYRWGAHTEVEQASHYHQNHEQGHSDLKPSCSSEDDSTTTGSTCSETEHPSEDMAASTPNTTLHSTANYHWGQSTAVFSPSPTAIAR